MKLHSDLPVYKVLDLLLGILVTKSFSKEYKYTDYYWDRLKKTKINY
jgi:hypothetical protein